MWTKIKDFFKGVVSEMRRVSWASRRELVGTTSAVLILTVLMSLVILGLDTLFRLLLEAVLKLAG